MKQNRLFLCLNAVLAAFVLLCDLAYMEEGGLLLKSVTSFGFVVMGAINLLYALGRRVSNRRFPILMLVGLTLCMAGDVAINLNFIAGALVFALGHVFYFIAYTALMRIRAVHLIPTAIIFAASAAILLGLPVFDFGGVLMQGICLFYALVISFMWGKAVGNMVEHRTPVTVIMAVGSALFFFSDLMLLFDVFAIEPFPLTDELCLLTYYPAQCLLAFAVYLYARLDGSRAGN